MGKPAATIHAPEGIEIDILVYLTSDETGIDVVGRIGGMTALPEFTGNASPDGLVKALGPHTLANDWRLMSREEIANYKRREREGEED